MTVCPEASDLLELLALVMAIFIPAMLVMSVLLRLLDALLDRVGGWLYRRRETRRIAHREVRRFDGYVCPHGHVDSDDCPDCRH